MIYNTVLFDLDDTLHDRNKTLCNFSTLFMAKYSHLMDDSRLNIKELLIRVDCKGYRPRAEMLKDLTSKIKWKSTPAIAELVDFWNAEFPGCAEPMPYLYEVLDDLQEKNIKMGMVTNGGTNFQNAKIKKLNLRKYMDCIIISEEAGISKPDPAIFRLALSKMDASPKSTLFVGDYPSTDILGAMNAGLDAAWLSNREIWNIVQYAPKYTLENLTDLKKLLFI